MLHRLKAMLINTLLMITAALFTILLLEGSYYLVCYMKHGQFRENGTHRYDQVLGWRANENVRLNSRPSHIPTGRAYERSFWTDEHGSRLWGTRPGKPKVLIIGDSFTEAYDVANDKTYYSVFNGLTDFDVYAYGVAGYGTLQELLALKRLLPLIKPDVFILQFCTNDFVNNSIDLERESITFSQTIRPYWVHGQITYRWSKWHPLSFGLRHSRLFSRLEHGVEILFFNKLGSDTWPINDWREDQRRKTESVKTTDALLGQMADLFPEKTRLYAFLCDKDENAEDKQHFLRLARSNRFTVLEGVLDCVRSHESKSETILADDGVHLNDLGNRLLGEELAKRLPKRQGVLSSPD